ARELEPRAEWGPQPRDHVRDRLVGRDRALDDVDEVEHPGPRQRRRDLEPVALGQSALDVLATGHPDADDEVVADLGPDRLEHFDRETYPVGEGAAIAIAPTVDQGRPELVEEMAVGD